MKAGKPPLASPPAGRASPPRRPAAGARAPSRRSTTLLLDASSLVYRAYFAIPRTVTGADGRPVNAVHGYLDMTTRLIASRRPDRVVHVHDHDWRPATRVSAYAGYKSQRTEEPDDLTAQFELLGRVLEAAGFEQGEAPGWEAEDAIGALAARRKKTETVEIVTGDRDLIQLVRDPDVRVLFTLRGVTDLRVLDEAAVEERYGVPASRYADFAILRGDPSDGLPGVRGIGEKTAKILVRAYPDLGALVEDARPHRLAGALGRCSPALRDAVREAAPYLTAMRTVVPIRTDVKVRTWGGTRNDARLDRLAKRHKLEGPVRRLRQALGPTAPPRGAGPRRDAKGSAGSARGGTPGR